LAPIAWTTDKKALGVGSLSVFCSGMTENREQQKQDAEQHIRSLSPLQLFLINKKWLMTSSSDSSLAALHQLTERKEYRVFPRLAPILSTCFLPECHTCSHRPDVPVAQPNSMASIGNSEVPKATAHFPSAARQVTEA